MFETVKVCGGAVDSRTGNFCPDETAQAVAAIEAECFSPPLAEEQVLRLLRDERTSWLLLYEKDSGSLAGYVWVQTVLDEGYIGNVAVRGLFRRRGGGNLLLNALDELAHQLRLRFLTLEVRAGNLAARSLYEKHGYRRTGLRPGYYSAPREDAVLMTKEFNAIHEDTGI